jgi:UDP-2-acetamido-3-amino-2,3-dideoxy-glucuronate N-acetyltransferase
MPSDQTAPALVLSPTASVGRDVAFGANVVVHDGVVIGDGVTVQDNVVLGKAPRLRPGSDAAGRPLEALVIEEGAAVCAGAIVFAGAHLGPGAIVGDQAYVRERARIGAGSLVGRGTAVDNDVVIGARVSVQTNVYLTAFSLVEDDVFVGPGATTTNDDAMGRHPRGAPLRGAVLRRACRIGGGAVLVPGIEIGEEAFVAAGAVVTNDVAPRAVVMGVPARTVRRVPDEDLVERYR